MSAPDLIRPNPPAAGNSGPIGAAANGAPARLAADRLNQFARPMLSRDAHAMYWMARYVERAEHVARFLLVNSTLLIDVADVAPSLQKQQWLGMLDILRLATPATVAAMCDPKEGGGPIAQRIARFLSFQSDNPSSLISCLSRARENARAIREVISTEMWENLNQLYWSIRSEDAEARFDDAPDDFYRSIMTGSMLFQGLTDQTLAHDQRWLFTQVAKYLERIDVTARVLETKFAILKGAEATLETALRNIHWMAVLRSCCAIEAYRRNYLGEMDPLLVTSFLILQKNFPRSIAFCVERARDAVAGLREANAPAASAGVKVAPAERILGRLSAQLEYAEPKEIMAEGLGVYLQRIQQQTAEAAVALQHSYFLT
jgi:uncharacterized alpha-E superfamily protein